MARHVDGVEHLRDAERVARGVEGELEVRLLHRLVLGLAHRLRIDQVGTEGLDERAECGAVLPRRVEVGDLHLAARAVLHLFLSPQQQPLLRRAVALRNLLHREPQDERPDHAEDEHLILLEDILCGVLVGDALVLDEAIDVLEWYVEVLDLLELGHALLVVLAEALLRDNLDQLQQLDAVGKVSLQVIDLQAHLAEMKVDPCRKRLDLHTLARLIGVLVGH